MHKNRYNINSFEKPKVIETAEGFLQIKGNILKADSFMDYMSKKGVLREKIPKEILFNEETKNSFMHKKVTLEHPIQSGKLTMINSENVGKFGKGTIIEVFENGDCLGATLQVEDSSTINFIKEKMNRNENIELSAGYTANVEGIKDNEFIQKDIVANHVAILSGKGRAGYDVKLIYNYLDYEEEKEMLKFNGKDVTPEELLTEAISLQNKLNASEEEKKKKEEEKAEIEKAKKETEDELEKEKEEKEKLKNKLNELEIGIKDKEIREKAKQVLNSIDEKDTTVKIMETVIKTANPKFNTADNSTIETLEEKFNFALDVLENNSQGTSPSVTQGEKYNENETLTWEIDNTYFATKRNGGN